MAITVGLDPKKARAQHRARVARELEPAIARLRALTAARFPAESAALPAGALKLTKITWAKPILDLYTYSLSAWKFDLEQARSGAVEAAHAALTPERLDRLGVTALYREANHADFAAKRSLYDDCSPAAAISIVAAALERVLQLSVAEGLDADAVIAAAT